MLRNVPACSVMFHVPGFIGARELARQSDAKRKQAPQSEANVCRRRRQMQSRKNLPY